MPTYAEADGPVDVDGITLDQVGGRYSHALLTDLLRRRKGFDGVVLSDWGIMGDCSGLCLDGAPEGVTPLVFFPQFGTPSGSAATARGQLRQKAEANRCQRASSSRRNLPS